MTRHRALFLLPALLLGSCGDFESSITPPTYPALNSSGAFSSGSIVDHGPMEAIGCTPLGDSMMVGAVGIPLSVSEVVRYDCIGISNDSIVGAVGAVLSATADRPGVATATVYGYWKLVYILWDCDSPPGGGGGYYAENGAWVLEEIVAECRRRQIFEWEAEPGYNGPPDSPPGFDGADGPGHGGGHEPPSGPPNEDVLDFVEWPSLVPAADTINCTLYQVNEGARHYCEESTPITQLDPSYMQKLTAANERMRSLGGLCATKASIVDSIIARTAIRSSVNGEDTGWAPLGFRGMGVIYLHDWLFTRYHSKARVGYLGSQPITLQFILSHEVDHLMGIAGHVDGANGAVTEHSLECSDLIPD